jgi:predicted component of type VI protein secretion system
MSNALERIAAALEALVAAEGGAATPAAPAPVAQPAPAPVAQPAPAPAPVAQPAPVVEMTAQEANEALKAEAARLGATAGTIIFEEIKKLGGASLMDLTGAQLQSLVTTVKSIQTA